MKARTSFLIGYWLAGVSVVVLLGLSGCGASFALRVVDERAGEIYISYSKGTAITVGDMFAVYQTVVHSGGSSSGGHQHESSGGHSSREMVATVKVIAIIDETLAQAEVISGKVRDGLSVEKIK
jgi:hypothetical protein